MGWILLGIVLFILFWLGRQNLEIYKYQSSKYKDWEPNKLPLIVWILVAIIALTPVVGLIAFILWLLIFSIKISCCMDRSNNYCIDDIRVVPGKKNWVWTVVKVLSKRY